MLPSVKLRLSLVYKYNLGRYAWHIRRCNRRTLMAFLDPYEYICCLQDMLTVLRCRRNVNDVTVGGQLTVDTEPAVSAESDADAGNCSASDSGRGLSYEAVSDDVRMHNQVRVRARHSRHDNKLRAHATDVEVSTGGNQSDHPLGKTCFCVKYRQEDLSIDYQFSMASGQYVADAIRR